MRTRWIVLANVIQGGSISGGWKAEVRRDHKDVRASLNNLLTGKSSSKHSERKREGSWKKMEEKDNKQKEGNEKTSVSVKGQMEIDIEKGNSSELKEKGNNNDKSSFNGGSEEDHSLKPQDLSEELNKDYGDHNVLTGDGS